MPRFTRKEKITSRLTFLACFFVAILLFAFSEIPQWAMESPQPDSVSRRYVFLLFIIIFPAGFFAGHVLMIFFARPFFSKKEILDYTEKLDALGRMSSWIPLRIKQKIIQGLWK